MAMVLAWELSLRKKRKLMAKNEDKDLQGYTPDDPEYWTLLGRSLGNPVPDYVEGEDDGYIDENGVVIKDDKEPNK